MVRYLVATHGVLAKGFESALQILLGNLDNIEFISCYVDDSNTQKQIEEFINSIGDDQLIMFSDICGGSVNQIMNQYLQRENTYQVTGVNLAVLIEMLATNKDSYSKKELEMIVANAKDNLQLVNLQIDVSEEEEDFF